MFNIGPMELLVILVLALIVVGPAKLPEVGRTIGKALREFRKAQEEVRQTLTLDLDEPEPPRRAVRSSARPGPHPPAPSEDHPVEDRLRAARDEGPAVGGPEGGTGSAGEEPDPDGSEPGQGVAREAGATGDAAAPARSGGAPEEPPAATPRS